MADKECGRERTKTNNEVCEKDGGEATVNTATVLEHGGYVNDGFIVTELTIEEPNKMTPVSNIKETYGMQLHDDSSKCDPENAGEEIGPPDGGWGWVVCFAFFMESFIFDGIFYTFGILFIHLTDNFNSNKGSAAMISSLAFSICFLSGSVTAPLCNRFGYRIVTIIGASMSSCGFILSSFAMNLEFLYFSYGIVAGFGYGMTFLPSAMVVTVYFDKKRSFATGLALCGNGLGVFVMSPVTEWLLQQYTWRGAFLIQAGMLFHGVLCGLVYLPLTRKADLNIKPQPHKPEGLVILSASINGTSVKCPQRLDPDDTDMRSDVWIDKMVVLERGCLSNTTNTTPIVHTRMNYPDSKTEGKEQILGATNMLYDNVNLDVYQENAIQDSTNNNSHETLTLDIHRDYPNSVNLISNNTTSNTNSTTVSSGTHRDELINANQTSKNAATCMKYTNPSLDLENENDNSETVNQARERITNKSFTEFSLDVQKDNQEVVIQVTDTSVVVYNHIENAHSDEKVKKKQYVYSNPIYLNQQTDTTSIWYPILNILDVTAKGVNSVLSETVENMSMLRNWKFCLYIVSNVMFQLALYVPFVYLPDLFQQKGMGPYRSAWLLSSVGLASIVSRVVAGKLTDLPCVNRLVVHGTALSTSGLVYIVIPVCVSFTANMCLTIVYGICHGVTNILITVLVVDLVGTENVTKGFGARSVFSAFASFSGPPFAGWLFDRTQSYSVPFFACGSILVVSGMLLCAIPVVSYLNRQRRA